MSDLKRYDVVVSARHGRIVRTTLLLSDEDAKKQGLTEKDLVKAKAAVKPANKAAVKPANKAAVKPAAEGTSAGPADNTSSGQTAGE